MWQLTVKDVLIQQGLDDALEKTKPKEMSDTDWAKIQKRAASTIRLALAPEVRYNVLKESTPKEIWDKLTVKKFKILYKHENIHEPISIPLLWLICLLDIII
ncbi:hypothetical protein DCAR_0205637 [Daucus carota subsp. sativus]|uniref:Retrovirus-related Pol polyprotein from transposon TNT 1-94 n=1 Tax=Daucus carota subsp. sativus TaxID=79200 RepID=A0AAF0WDT2_DAUCS|nr:hypothetical protein DCAR_0205637 [Daucus carota subsp. sativus]